ncbi:hypothetical protein PDESU_05242 [Pontiella desulfatans]|uniref:Outer membrane protein beta-barrel domain-containing protein n=1 Tax=Pontiella desulfatans TaxID=2750659 RepID=A0A6C2UAW1_PONDE|nr:outer membrane beta-barrel protein [Pontiella desulfatans]VGO16651.1 hypothetical protein PDESU_05242 [Pontiella desulfatans]
MFKKITVLFAMIATTSIAQAEGTYAGGAVNYLNINDANDAGFSIEGFVGMSLAEALRGEFALSADQAEFGSKKVRMVDIFANLYYDFKLESKVNPYVLGGIGYGSAATGDWFSSSSRDGNLLGQVGAGIAFPVSKQVMLDFKYRYQFSSDYYLPNTRTFQLTGHSLGLGFRYSF